MAIISPLPLLCHHTYVYSLPQLIYLTLLVHHGAPGGRGRAQGLMTTLIRGAAQRG